MPFGGRIAALSAVALLTGCVLASCGSGPSDAQKHAVRNILTTTTTTAPPTTSTSSVASTTQPGVAVPNVIGLKIAAARAALRAATLLSVGLNTPCNKGTLASQSVASSLAIPGRAPDVRVGAVPLNPGAVVAPGTRIGITWSGCFGDASVVPAVVGLTLTAARHALHAVGLSWACYSVGKETTTTTEKPTTTTNPSDPSTSTPTPATTTTVTTPQTVLTQNPAAQAVLHPGATVSLTMHHCPQ